MDKNGKPGAGEDRELYRNPEAGGGVLRLKFDA